MFHRRVLPVIVALLVAAASASAPAVLASGAASKPPADPPAQPSNDSKSPSDPAAVSVVQKMIDAMGGADAVQNAGAMRFTFTYTSKDTLRTERTHWWDRRTGAYRIQGKTRKGETYVLLFNTGTKDGRAWLDGRELAGAEKDQYLQRAYALFINDTYWFLMPAKLFDPGVHLAMDGEGVVNGSPADRVKVTFDNVGLTPGDTYWAYIDRNTHLMSRWGMILQGERDKPDAHEEMYDWNGWKAYGPLTLSPDRVRVDDPDKTLIQIRNIEVADSLPADVFTNSAPIDVSGAAH